MRADFVQRLILLSAHALVLGQRNVTYAVQLKRNLARSNLKRRYEPAQADRTRLDPGHTPRSKTVPLELIN